MVPWYFVFKQAAIMYQTGSEMLTYAKEQMPWNIYIDEIYTLGGIRLQEDSSTDHEVQRPLMELLAQIDGFSSSSKIKVIIATNRSDVLDLCWGRIDRKIKIPLSNEQSRLET